MIHIRPRVGMYSAFSRLNYTPWYAIAEFVDNSIQSFVANEGRLADADGRAARLVVTIEVLGDRITVSDNAAGICAADFPRAFVPAEPPADTTGLSEFGLGMKAAACWFGKTWWVRTKALGERVERTIRFDVPNIVERGVEELEATERSAEVNAHYTTLVIEGLHHPPKGRTVGKIKSYLGGMYRRFLSSERVRITYNNVDVAYEPPEVLVAPRYTDPKGQAVAWKKEFDLKLDAKHRVVGWAALRDRASTTEAGFAIFRRDRLVMGGADNPYRPQEIFGTPNKFTYQRLFGELSVEGFHVSHTKDGLQWSEWEEDILDWLSDELDKEPLPLLKQAEGFRARAGRAPPAPGFGSAAVKGTADALGTHAACVITEQIERPGNAPPPPDTLAEPEQITASREVEIDLEHRQQRWKVNVEIVRDPAAEDWYTFSLHHGAAPGEHSVVRIRLNLGHPFSEQFLIGHEDELDPVLRLAAGLAISEVTAAESGVRQAPTIRRNLNHLLREALWRRE